MVLRFDRWKHASFLYSALPAGLNRTPTMQQGGERWHRTPCHAGALLTRSKPSQLAKCVPAETLSFMLPPRLTLQQQARLLSEMLSVGLHNDFLNFLESNKIDCQLG